MWKLGFVLWLIVYAQSNFWSSYLTLWRIECESNAIYFHSTVLHCKMLGNIFIRFPQYPQGPMVRIVGPQGRVYSCNASENNHFVTSGREQVGAAVFVSGPPYGNVAIWRGSPRSAATHGHQKNPPQKLAGASRLVPIWRAEKHIRKTSLELARIAFTPFSSPLLIDLLSLST
jgi:hypothetical protein